VPLPLFARAPDCFGSRGPESPAFNAALRACDKCWQTGQCFHLLELMADLDVLKDEDTFALALTVCEKAGSWERALALLDEMASEGALRDELHVKLALAACERAQQVCAALRCAALRFAANCVGLVCGCNHWAGEWCSGLVRGCTASAGRRLVGCCSAAARLLVSTAHAH
jgi:pentatricopeptide repeat protein